MNVMPDELWANEQYHTRAIQDLSASDADGVIVSLPATTGFIVASVALGMCLILSWFAVAALGLGAILGSKRIQKRLKRRGIGFGPGVRHTS